MSTIFQILDRADHPKGKWSGYRRIAVVEVDPTKLPEGRAEPFAISERSRGIVRIIATWNSLFVGHTAQCAYIRAWREAESLVAKLIADRAAQRKREARKAARVWAATQYEEADAAALVLADAFLEVGRAHSGSPKQWHWQTLQAYADSLLLLNSFDNVIRNK